MMEKEIPLLENNPLEEDIITPKEEYEYDLKKAKRLNYPELCFIFFQEEFLEIFKENTNSKNIEKLLGKDLYVCNTEEKEFATIHFGIGAPMSALLLERLIARGIKKFIAIGISGSLNSEFNPGDIYLCKKSIRDEGVSYHYLSPSKYSEPSEILNQIIIEKLTEGKIPFNEGISWTTDAGYKESKFKAEKYRKEGVICIDMESASLFAVAKHRKIDLSSIFILSDFVDKKLKWNPKFYDKKIKESLKKIKKALISIT
jgi:uridine phosphorylase